MYNLKALKGKTEQEMLAFWCLVFMPLIVKAALPMRAISDEKFIDGVAAGMVLVLTNVSGRGTFDPKKGNIIEWFRKAIAGVRMEARDDAVAGTTSLDAMLERSEEGDLDIPDTEAELTEDHMDDFELELSNWMRMHVEDVLQEPVNPSDETVKFGDPQNDRILFTVPAETSCPVYYSKIEQFEMVDGKPVSKGILLKCVPQIQKRGAAEYAGDESDDTTDRAWRTTLDQDGELTTDYDADFRHDPDGESDFASFMESHEGLFSRKALRDGVHSWVGKGKKQAYISPYTPDQKRKKGEIDEPVKGDVELCIPGEVEAEMLLNPYQAPTVEQMGKAMEVFEANALAIKHLAYLQWKGQPDVTVTSLDVRRGGFIKADGRFMSMAVAAGIAAAIKPQSGATDKMIQAVRDNFPMSADAQLFVERVQAVAQLPL